MRSWYIKNLSPDTSGQNSICNEGISASFRLHWTGKTAKSSATPIKYGNDVLVSDVQNLYNENNEYFYVASNSLPSYEIQEGVKKSSITTANSTTLQGYDSSTDRYSIISFNSSVEFLTGDRIYYKPSNVSLIGLEEGDYYVKVLSPNNKIKLYIER